MSADNPLWGAPRIHGELLKLGFEVAQSSVAKYMVKRPGPPSQGWCTFVRNHSLDIAAMDLFVTPTIGFQLLYAFIIVRLARRELVWINVTPHPTADWIARQITEAFPWNESAFRDKPIGMLRLSMPRVATVTLVGPLLPQFLAKFPEIKLEVNVDDTHSRYRRPPVRCRHSARRAHRERYDCRASSR
jgi:hypothetical protein